MKRLAKIQRALKAPKDQRNNFGKFNYRKASDILQAVKPLLEEDNLTILLNDEIKEISGKHYLVATVGLYDDEGKEIASTSAYAETGAHAGMSSEQATGSASSYARKYALCGLFAIDDSSMDPDGLESPAEPTTSKPSKQAVDEMKAAQDETEVRALWSRYKQFQNDQDFVKAKDDKKKELGIK